MYMIIYIVFFLIEVRVLSQGTNNIVFIEVVILSQSQLMTVLLLQVPK